MKVLFIYRTDNFVEVRKEGKLPQGLSPHSGLTVWVTDNIHLVVQKVGVRVVAPSPRFPQAVLYLQSCDKIRCKFRHNETLILKTLRSEGWKPPEA